MKKLTTLGIASVMALGLLVPAFADIDISGIITVDWYDNERDANVLDFGNEAGARMYTTESSLTNSGEPMTFDITTLELDLEADVTENISVRTDIEFDGGMGRSDAAGVNVEQAYVKIAEIFDWPVDVVLGKFNSPWGVEPEERADLKLITYSLVTTFADINQQTGLAVSGGVSFIDYVVYVSNGISPQITTDTDPSGWNYGNALTGVAAAGGTGLVAADGPYDVDIDLNDNDNNMALGFRVGIAPEFVEGFEAGISFVVAEIDPDRQYLSDRISRGNLYWNPNGSPMAAAATTGGEPPRLDDPGFEEQVVMFDVDAIYQTGPFEFRGEYVNGRVRPDNGFMKLNYNGFSFQASYDITDRLGLVARLANYNQNENAYQSQSREQISMGVNYKVADNVNTKIEYSIRSEDAGLSSGTAAGEGAGNIGGFVAGRDPMNNRVQGRDGVNPSVDMFAEDKNHFIGAELAVQF